jgi:hypothetical protein
VPVYHVGAIDLAAKRASVLRAYTEVLMQAGENTGQLVGSYIRDPAPIVGQIARNLLGTGQDFGRAVSDALSRSVDALRNDVPPLLKQAREQFQSGDVSGGVDSLLAALVAPLTPFNEVGGAIAAALGQPFASIGRVVTALAQPEFVVGAVLSVLGPVISTVGATGVAIQHIFDAVGGGNASEQLAVGTKAPGALIRALAVAPATILDGLLNGGYGPDLSPLLGRPASTEEAAALIERGRVLAGGLLSGVQVKRAERALVDRAAVIGEGDRILPGPIGGIQAVRLTVARAISPRVKYAEAADATVAQGNSVTLTVAPADSNAKRTRALDARAASQDSAKVQKPVRQTKASDGVGKHRKTSD